MEQTKNAWRTPISGVKGFVTLEEDKEEKMTFYGCNETGVVWWEKKSFYKAIEKVINECPHRADCYKKVGEEWLPNEAEPANIEELIKEEKKSKLGDYYSF